MGENILELKKKWNWRDGVFLPTEAEIESFQSLNGLLIPKDLTNYFKILNGTNGYDEGFFSFYSLNKFQSFDHSESLFIFADYQIKLFSYVIKLYKAKTINNEVYIYCGEDCKIIANSFTEFIDLCLLDSQKLFFND